MKKTLVTLFSVLLTLCCFIGCENPANSGGDTTDNTDDTNNTQTETPWWVGTWESPVYSMSDEWWYIGTWESPIWYDEDEKSTFQYIYEILPPNELYYHSYEIRPGTYKVKFINYDTKEIIKTFEEKWEFVHVSGVVAEHVAQLFQDFGLNCSCLDLGIIAEVNKTPSTLFMPKFGATDCPKQLGILNGIDDNGINFDFYTKTTDDINVNLKIIYETNKDYTYTSYIKDADSGVIYNDTPSYLSVMNKNQTVISTTGYTKKGILEKTFFGLYFDGISFYEDTKTLADGSFTKIK